MAIHTSCVSQSPWSPGSARVQNKNGVHGTALEHRRRNDCRCCACYPPARGPEPRMIHVRPRNHVTAAPAGNGLLAARHKPHLSSRSGRDCATKEDPHHTTTQQPTPTPTKTTKARKTTRQKGAVLM